MRNLITAPRAPGAHESSPENIRISRPQKRELTKKFTQLYQENIDAALNASGLNDQEKNDTRIFLELIKNEAIDLAKKANLNVEQIPELIQQMLHDKEAITQQIKKRETAIKSLKGKLGYWKNYAKQRETVTEIGKDLPRRIKEFRDGLKRVDELTKQIRKAEKSGLDLKFMGEEPKPFDASLTNLHRAAENTDAHPTEPTIQQPETSEEIPATVDEPTVVDAVPPDQIKNNAFEARLVQTDAVEQKEREQTINGKQIALRYDTQSENYFIDLPFAQTKIPVGNQEQHAQKIYEQSIEDIQEYFPTPDENENDKEAFTKKQFEIISNRIRMLAGVKETSVSTRHRENENLPQLASRGLPELVAKNLPELAAKDLPSRIDDVTGTPAPMRKQYEPYPIYISDFKDGLGEPLSTETPKPEKQGRIFTEEEQYFRRWMNVRNPNEMALLEAWNSYTNDDAAKDSLISFGFPKKLLKGDSLLQIWFASNSSPFFSKQKIKGAMNRFIEEANIDKANQKRKAYDKKHEGSDKKPKGLVQDVSRKTISYGNMVEAAGNRPPTIDAEKGGRELKKLEQAQATQEAIDTLAGIDQGSYFEGREEPQVVSQPEKTTSHEVPEDKEDFKLRADVDENSLYLDWNMEQNQYEISLPDSKERVLVGANPEEAKQWFETIKNGLENTSLVEEERNEQIENMFDNINRIRVEQTLSQELSKLIHVDERSIEKAKQTFQSLTPEQRSKAGLPETWRDVLAINQDGFFKRLSNSLFGTEARKKKQIFDYLNDPKVIAMAESQRT